MGRKDYVAKVSGIDGEFQIVVEEDGGVHRTVVCHNSFLGRFVYSKNDPDVDELKIIVLDYCQEYLAKHVMHEDVTIIPKETAEHKPPLGYYKVQVVVVGIQYAYCHYYEMMSSYPITEEAIEKYLTEEEDFNASTATYYILNPRENYAIVDLD